MGISVQVRELEPAAGYINLIDWGKGWVGVCVRLAGTAGAAETVGSGDPGGAGDTLWGLRWLLIGTFKYYSCADGGLGLQLKKNA